MLNIGGVSFVAATPLEAGDLFLEAGLLGGGRLVLRLIGLGKVGPSLREVRPNGAGMVPCAELE
jgi:hypothetical protein